MVCTMSSEACVLVLTQLPAHSVTPFVFMHDLSSLSLSPPNPSLPACFPPHPPLPPFPPPSLSLCLNFHRVR